MADNEHSYNVGEIRNLLSTAFDDVGLVALCQDEFPDLCEILSRGLRKDEILNVILDYFRRRGDFASLLTAIQTREPVVYARLAPCLYTTPAEQDRPRVVNLRPLDMPRAFRGRTRERRDLCTYLADNNVRLISIVGRAGMGKTALASHVMEYLERSILPVPGDEQEFPTDGILYLGARSTGLSLDRLYADVARMLGEPAASQLAARWTYGDAPLSAKVEYLLEALRDGQYLILLDNLEDYQTAKGIITDEGLRLFVEHGLTRPSGVRLIVTSRVAVKVPAAALRGTRCVSLREGLSEGNAFALLQDLDPQGELGLRDAGVDDLQRAISLTQGIPRALEILAGILHQDLTTSLLRLLADEDLFGEQVVEQLVVAGYRRLGDDERRVMESLAVFDRPVGEDSVTHLLQPWFPDLDVRASLRRLATSYFVRADRTTGEYSLHLLDREYAYRQLPDGDEPDVYARRNLELRAADYYASIRKPESEWETIEDLAPQLAEFEHRIRAGDYNGAGRVLDPINDHLFLWGHYTRLVELREILQGHLTDLALQAQNLGSLGNTWRNLGQSEQAIKLYEQALAIVREIGDRQAEGIWLGNLGSIYRDSMQLEQARKLYEQALSIARENNDLLSESISLGRLVLICNALGQFELSFEFGEKALAISRNIHDRWGEGNLLSNLGRTYHALGQTEQAIKLHEEALAIAREIGHRRAEGACLDELGLAAYTLGEFNQAIQLHQQALSIACEIGDQGDEHRRMLKLSKVLLAIGEYAQAQRYCAEILALGMPDINHRAMLYLGFALDCRRDPAAGKTFANTATCCRALLEKTVELYEARYTLAVALMGQATCDPRWAAANNRAELLAPALAEYRRALDNCSAPGVVQDAIRDLELIRAADIEGLEPVFELLESALPEKRPE